MTVKHTAHFDTVMVKSTDVAATAADKVALVSDLSIDRSRTNAEVLGHGDDLASNLVGARRVTINLSGQFKVGDAPQEAIAEAHKNGSLVYVTVVENEAAGLGDRVGDRYACYCTAYNASYPQDGIVTFDATFVLGSTTITEIVGAA